MRAFQTIKIIVRNIINDFFGIRSIVGKIQFITVETLNFSRIQHDSTNSQCFMFGLKGKKWRIKGRMTFI